ncbi:unnamed protein product [Bursaphelenchus xylophilus]|uniref:(pine wood nematode) hypothetical protein n=1 Tax=Bursaphelenchus xylophilus TaxID=6326 RepID=A0A1I7RT90_BURXY|nr:unnamed protein product [Bursaphelenchus xylophilus]CAG9122534.1 unnamed protein product [Bursaphelenchus xylophilus]
MMPHYHQPLFGQQVVYHPSSMSPPQGQHVDCNPKKLEFKHFREQEFTVFNKSNMRMQILLTIPEGFNCSPIRRIVEPRMNFTFTIVAGAEAENGLMTMEVKRTNDNGLLQKTDVKLIVNDPNEQPAPVVISDNMMFYNEQKFSDFVVKVGEKEIHVSRAIISRHSEYFQALFKSDFDETTTGVLKVENFSEGTIENMLKFLYGDQVDLAQNADEMIQVASFYQIAPMVDKCIMTLVDAVDENNYHEMILLGHQLQNDKLYSKAMKLGAEKFYSFDKTKKRPANSDKNDRSKRSRLNRGQELEVVAEVRRYPFPAYDPFVQMRAGYLQQPQIQPNRGPRDLVEFGRIDEHDDE